MRTSSLWFHHASPDTWCQTHTYSPPLASPSLSRSTSLSHLPTQPTQQHHIDGIPDVVVQDHIRPNSFIQQRSLKTPSDRRLFLTQLFTWFMTLAFASVATFETVYFFAYEQYKDEWAGLNTSSAIVLPDTPFNVSASSYTSSYTGPRSTNKTLEYWLSTLLKSIAFSWFVSKPGYILGKHIVLPWIGNKMFARRVRKAGGRRVKKSKKPTLKEAVMADLKLVKLDIDWRASVIETVSASSRALNTATPGRAKQAPKQSASLRALLHLEAKVAGDESKTTSTVVHGDRSNGGIEEQDDEQDDDRTRSSRGYSSGHRTDEERKRISKQKKRGSVKKRIDWEPAPHRHGSMDRSMSQGGDGDGVSMSISTSMRSVDFEDVDMPAYDNPMHAEGRERQQEERERQRQTRESFNIFGGGEEEGGNVPSHANPMHALRQKERNLQRQARDSFDVFNGGSEEVCVSSNENPMHNDGRERQERQRKTRESFEIFGGGGGEGAAFRGNPMHAHETRSQQPRLVCKRPKDPDPNAPWFEASSPQSSDTLTRRRIESMDFDHSEGMEEGAGYGSQPE